jgi:serine/threonine protein kinase
MLNSVSTVYKATSLVTRTPLIIKAYHKKKMVPKNVRRMEREILLMREHGGKGIIQIYSVFEDPETTCDLFPLLTSILTQFVMEW